jgi:apolipoprotein N-acyltransferase
VIKVFLSDFSTKNNLILGFSSAILLGISYPPFKIGIFALVGFVPFLILIDRIETYGRFFRYSYFTFFIFSIITLYWVGGFTHMADPYLMIAGGALLLFQPLFFSFVGVIYFFIRKNVPLLIGVLFFPFVWTTCEWLYALGEFAFPWLTVGNTQTYALNKIQFIDLTGVYGVSFWILTLNILVYFIVKRTDSLNLKVIWGKNYIIILLILGLFFLPDVYSIFELKNNYESERQLNIGIIQPNIDPWDKWDGANTFLGRWHQVDNYLSIIRLHKNDNLDLIVLPETAILLNLPTIGAQYNIYKNFIDSSKISIVTGYMKTQYYNELNAPNGSNNIKGTNTYYNSYNSVLFTQPNQYESQSYSKMRLVPFAERIPYAKDVTFLIEPLRWSVGISNWGLGEDSTIFIDSKNNNKFLAMVCYESIFPEFVSSFVKSGAEYMVFITNDSWWGNTSGARQHNQYSVLRAIENRRWVVRCANGGISSFVDPTGKMFDATSMYTQTFIKHIIHPRSELTFYSKHGDWFARICACITGLTLLILLGYQIQKKVK